MVWRKRVINGFFLKKPCRLCFETMASDTIVDAWHKSRELMGDGEHA